MEDTICLHYESKSQMWFLFPYASDSYFHTIWINDYVNKAWYKRVVPQDIVTACIYNGNVYTADKLGNIYREDFGTTFNGQVIQFMWKSPFLAISNAHHRKIIDEFYFLLDTENDNDFNFTVYKDYDSEMADDSERIYSVHEEHLIWADDNTPDNMPCFWPADDEDFPIWPVNKDSLEKAEISESNYSIQLCVSGENAGQSCAIIGLQFREIYNDD